MGGGFGCLSAAQALKSAPVDVTLIDRNDYRLFQPLIYQVATGSLSAGEIPAPLRSVLSRQKNARVLLGTVLDIDPLSRHVLLADGASFEYDWLIVAAVSHDSRALYCLRANGAISTACRKMQCKTYPIWGGDKS